MADITATLTPSDEIVVTKFAELPANFTLTQLNDTDITSPADGSYLIFNTSSGNFIDDNTIVKTSTGITLTGSLVVTTNVDVDGTLEADAITVNGITLAETISDTVGGMVDNNTESGIAVTYEDSTNTLDFDVADFSITLTGDVAGSGTVTNLGNVSFATTIQANSVALGTDTTGDYVGTITGGTGIDSTAATSGEGTTHTLSVDLNELGTETSIAQADFIAMVDATDNGSGKITLSNLEDEIFGNVSGDIAIAAGGAATIQATSVENSMLAGAIPNSKLANSTITVSDGSNTSPVALGGTLTFAGTSNEVTVAESSGTVTIGLPNDIAISGELEGGSLDINGDADISGSTVNHGNLSIYGSGGIALKEGNTTNKSAIISHNNAGNGVLSLKSFNTDQSSNRGTIFFDADTYIFNFEAAVTEARLTSSVFSIPAQLQATSLDINGNSDISGNLVLGGNLTVSGTTTTVSTTNTTVSDKLLELGTGTTGSASGDAGIIIERGDDANAFIGFDESADKFIVGTGTFTGASTGNLTITTGTLVSNLEGNVTGALTGNADTATTLATARDIGGVSFNGSASINLPGVNAAGNQDTSGNAATATVATTVTITDNESTDESNAIVFTAGGDVDGGNLGLESDGTLTYNPSTGKITATGFVGALTGNADTATNVAYTGLTGSVPTWNQDTTGTASKATVANSTANTNFPVVFNDESDGLLDDTGTFIYNPSTGLVSATGFSGALTGTLQTAAQANITSVGTLTGLSVNTSNAEASINVGTDFLKITCSDTDSGVLIESASGDSNQPDLILRRTNASSSTTNGEGIGNILFDAKNANEDNENYSAIVARVDDKTDGSEDGSLDFNIKVNGSFVKRIELDSVGSTFIGDVVVDTGSIKLKDASDNVTTISENASGNIALTLPSAAGTLALTSDVAGTTLTQAAQTNITSLGSLTALDVNGDADISGDLTLSAGGDGALTFGAASSIKVIDNSATALVIEEANTAYMTFNTADSGGEKIEFGKPIHGNLTGNVTGNADTATVATGTLTDHAGANVVEDETTNRSHDIVKTFVGKTFVYTGSGHVELGVPDVGVDISIGQQIHFINASSGSTSRIKLDLDESGTAQVITTCTGGGLTASGTTNPEIHQGGVATLIATSDNNYVMFGSGIINA